MPIRFRRMLYGIYTPKELLLFGIDAIRQKIFHKDSELYVHEHVKRLLKPDSEAYHIKDVKLPLLDRKNERILAAEIFNDTFHSYVFYNDKYDEETFNKCEKFLAEGLYGFVNDKVSVTVEPGDVVIDAGSWIGDFAAYASVKLCVGGGIVYAFEPSERNFEYLLKTAELNKNIIPVKKGLSDKTLTQKIFLNTESNSAGDSLMDKSASESFQKDYSTVETTTIDDFVKENGLKRVDFIKADIEGFERNMLKGAQETLKNFAPKLALCTYHLPDDPEVLAGLIKQANPKYNIVQRKMKLFASVN
ncbi:MAG: FkbM family methyltransferase [Synergistaceae bacterium]|nr:FkbM family methyltransferase [Synergistaceae bacterium]